MKKIPLKEFIEHAMTVPLKEGGGRLIIDRLVDEIEEIKKKIKELDSSICSKESRN